MKLSPELWITLCSWTSIFGVAVVICAWRGKLLRIRRMGHRGGPNISHGMCDSCAEKQIEDAHRLAEELKGE